MAANGKYTADIPCAGTIVDWARVKGEFEPYLGIFTG